MENLTSLIVLLTMSGIIIAPTIVLGGYIYRRIKGKKN